MRYTRYSRYTGEPWDSVDLEELVSRLSDYLLQSGYESQWYGFQDMGGERSMEQLRQAILRALETSELLFEDLMEQLLRDTNLERNADLKELLDRLTKMPLVRESFYGVESWGRLDVYWELAERNAALDLFQPSHLQQLGRLVDRIESLLNHPFLLGHVSLAKEQTSGHP